MAGALTAAVLSSTREISDVLDSTTTVAVCASKSCSLAAQAQSSAEWTSRTNRIYSFDSGDHPQLEAVASRVRPGTPVRMLSRSTHPFSTVDQAGVLAGTPQTENKFERILPHKNRTYLNFGLVVE